MFLTWRFTKRLINNYLQQWFCSMPTSGIPKNRRKKFINQCVFAVFVVDFTALSKATKRCATAYDEPFKKDVLLKTKK